MIRELLILRLTASPDTISVVIVGSQKLVDLLFPQNESHSISSEHDSVMDDMYEYVRQKLASVQDVAGLTIFIEKLLTVQHLQNDLLSLLGHYRKIHQSISDPSTTSKTTITTTTVTEVTLNSHDSYDLIRSLYVSLAPFTSILSNAVCGKILSFIPMKEMVTLSTVCRQFQYLVMDDPTASIYHHSRCRVSIYDTFRLSNGFNPLFIVHSETGNIEITSSSMNSDKQREYEQDPNIWMKPIRSIDRISDLEQIPYFRIPRWFISIGHSDESVSNHLNPPNTSKRVLRPKLQSLPNEQFESKMERQLKGIEANELATDSNSENIPSTDLTVKILEKSVDGICSLSLCGVAGNGLKSLNPINDRLSEYPVFHQVVVLQLSECILDYGLDALSHCKFPVLQCLTFEDLHFDDKSERFRTAVQSTFTSLIEDDSVLVKLAGTLSVDGLNPLNEELEDQQQDRYQLVLTKMLRVYRVIAQSITEWQTVHNAVHSLCGHKVGTVRALKVALKRSDLVKMVRVLLKCVRRRSELEKDLNGNSNGNSNRNSNGKLQRNQMERARQSVKRKLLAQSGTLRVVSSVEWLFISEMECKVDISLCTKLIGIQVHNVRVQQITFPLFHVVPAIGISTDQHQIVNDWRSYSNFKFSTFTVPDDALFDSSNSMRPPVRFLVFNGPMRPHLVQKIDSMESDSNRVIERILSILQNVRENRGIDKNGDTNRNLDFLCVFLDDGQRRDLFFKLITFAVNWWTDCDSKEKLITDIQHHVARCKRWWECYNAAQWVRDFGQKIAVKSSECCSS